MSTFMGFGDEQPEEQDVEVAEKKKFEPEFGKTLLNFSARGTRKAHAAVEMPYPLRVS